MRGTRGAALAAAALVTASLGASAIATASVDARAGEGAAGVTVVAGEKKVAKRVGFVIRHEKFEGTNPVALQAAPNPPIDPDRCVSWGFAEWPRQQYAIHYKVTVFPKGASDGTTLNQSDDAPYEVSGHHVSHNPAPPRFFQTVIGRIDWPKSVARLYLNSYSTGAGCGEAKRLTGRFDVKVNATLSIPIIRLVSDGPLPPVADKAPKGAVMRVVEVEGLLFRIGKDGKKHRLRYKDWVKPGDVLFAEEGGVAALELITGGRVGFVGGRSILILNEAQVQDITQEGQLAKPTRKALALWKKISQRKEPLEVETAGGVMGIKG